MKGEEPAELFSCTCYSSELWGFRLIGRCEKKVTGFLSSYSYLCNKRLAFCSFSDLLGFGFCIFYFCLIHFQCSYWF